MLPCRPRQPTPWLREQGLPGQGAQSPGVIVTSSEVLRGLDVGANGMGFTEVLTLTPASTTERRRGARQRMNLDEPTSCPKWFPILLLGMGVVGAFARQILL